MHDAGQRANIFTVYVAWVHQLKLARRSHEYVLSHADSESSSEHVVVFTASATVVTGAVVPKVGFVNNECEGVVFG